MTYWGYHLVANFGRCNPEMIRCAPNITLFAKSLVKKIDMVPYGEPQVQHFGHGNKAGFTLVQLIETSNITAHFVEETNDIYLDVFSCKKFDKMDVHYMVNEFFQPESAKIITIKRQAPVKNERTTYQAFELK
jgi:S-adenosylmethionine decarboxylase